MKNVDIYTDGACSGNPGPGGWGAILKFGEVSKEISGFKDHTTNNQMELIAAIEALMRLKEKCHVTLYSDSSYLINAFNKKWIYFWKKNGWITSSNTKVKNEDLWEQLDTLNSYHKIAWVKVKGHSDNEHNNRCDALATEQIKRERRKEIGVC